MMTSNEAQKLLIVEDEEHLAAGLKLNLELEGYRVEVAANAKEAGQRLLDPNGYDAIVLDVMLPDVNGFELCKRFRDAGNFVPVIMLTARSSPEDRVLGLEAGADDYMVKPFELGELLARVRSVLRRQRWEQVTGGSAKASTLSFGGAQINFDTHDVQVAGEQVQLTQLELDLLRYFASFSNGFGSFATTETPVPSTISSPACAEDSKRTPAHRRTSSPSEAPATNSSPRKSEPSAFSAAHLFKRGLAFTEL
jgi:two-component system OmpR family response regulator